MLRHFEIFGRHRLFRTLVRLFCSQKSLLLENLALRQQLSVLKRRHPCSSLDLSDRLFDFYAAYEAISCPQQKCLLHLIRDFNDAVLDNPYDESIKGIATTFAGLFKEIVKTTDRWGLRSRFLRKHLADVARFYKRISKMEYLRQRL